MFFFFKLNLSLISFISFLKTIPDCQECMLFMSLTWCVGEGDWFSFLAISSPTRKYYVTWSSSSENKDMVVYYYDPLHQLSFNAYLLWLHLLSFTLEDSHTQFTKSPSFKYVCLVFVFTMHCGIHLWCLLYYFWVVHQLFFACACSLCLCVCVCSRKNKYPWIITFIQNESLYAVVHSSMLTFWVLWICK